MKSLSPFFKYWPNFADFLEFYCQFLIVYCIIYGEIYVNQSISNNSPLNVL